jgi:hypothetical protein
MNTYKITLLLGIILSFNSCKKLTENDNSFIFPTITDTIPKLQYYLSPESRNVPLNFIFAINPIGQNINLMDIDNNPCKDFEWFIYNPPKNRDTDSLNIYLDISVETCQERYVGRIPELLNVEHYRTTFLTIPSTEENENINVMIDSTRTDWKRLIDVYIKTIPVFIVNQTNTAKLIVSNCNSLYIIQEALDTDGQWKPIEYYNEEDWGGSYFELKPGYYIMTQVFKYSGPYNTKLRLKFTNGDNEYYSKEFVGSINPKQFNYSGLYKN